MINYSHFRKLPQTGSGPAAYRSTDPEGTHPPPGWPLDLNPSRRKVLFTSCLLHLLNRRFDYTGKTKLSNRRGTQAQPARAAAVHTPGISPANSFIFLRILMSILKGSSKMASRPSAEAACAFDGMLPVSDSAAFLTHFDFSAIDEMDPSLADGHMILYEREVPCELRMQEGSKAPQDVGRLEPIRVKILILGEETKPQEVRIEAASENDLFFHYTHVVDEKAFRQMQQSQKLMIAFPDYSQVLMRMLNSCIREPQSFLAVFIMETTGKGRLDFIQNMEYKFIELLSCDFLQSSEEVIRQQMSFRYNSLKSRLALMHARLHDIGALVKVKSPSLLLHLQKSAAQSQQTKRQTRGSSLNQITK